MISQDLRDAIRDQSGTLPHLLAASRSPTTSRKSQKTRKIAKFEVEMQIFRVYFCTTILCDFLDHMWTKSLVTR